MGLKGCTTFRSNPITGREQAEGTEAPHCCVAEREAD
jgi:ribonucleoside-diphosphate reductase alpha chain